MQRRLFLLFLSALPYASESVANSAAWNCEQSKDGKEWVCDGDSKSPESSPVPISETPISVEPPAVVEIENVAPVVEIINPEPIVSSPVEKVTAEKEFVRPMPVTQKVESSHGLSILPAAFDATQEQTFNVLKSQLKIDPWEHCSNPNAPKKTQIRSNKGDRIHAPINVKSNYSEIFENEISSYFGNVRIDRADQQMSSNAANYDSVTGKLDAQGDVYYSDDDMAVHTDAASFDLASDQAKLRDVLFIAPSVPLRGYAGAAYRDSKTVSHYQDVAYTSCPTGNQDWVVHAGELKIDKEDGRGSAKNAWLEFKGTPVFYSPYLSFPTDSRRTSGFLAPSFGSTQRSGFNISTPYYFNIAENYDATFRPRYLTKRGILLAGESRYLTENSYGQLNAEILPNDYLRQDKPRYFASFKDTTKFTDKIQANVDLNFVSDKNYFAELGSALSMPNFSYLKSQADFGYYGDEISAVGRVENYQSIDKYLTGDKLPYRKLPQVNVNLKHGFDQLPVPVNVAMENEFIYFQHTSLLNGQRSNIKPSVSLPLQSGSAYVTPKVSLQYTNYFLSNPLTAGDSRQIDRTLPIFSTDSGMTFERNLNLGGKGFLNTIEPRLFYLYIPRTNQNDIQVFDTAVYDMWFNTLFRENRFSGIDRMQDANQMTAAVTSRLIDEQTGKEQAKFSLGNIVYFQDRTVTMPIIDPATGNKIGDSPVETSRFSNIIGELSTRINDHVSIDSGLQWNPHESDISRGKAILHLTNQPNEILNLGYRYRKNTVPDVAQAISTGISQSDVSFHYPIYDNWSAIGRWQYSLLYNSTQESFFGVEKENCCWRFRVVGRRYLNNLNVFANDADVQGTSQTGVFFQVELKGLTGMGEKLDTFLEQNIYGYRSAPSY
jgi:LPS-assembly protein